MRYPSLHPFDTCLPPTASLPFLFPVPCFPPFPLASTPFPALTPHASHAMGRKHVPDPTTLTDRKSRNTDLVAPPGFDEGVKRRDGRLYPGLSAAKVRDAFLDIARGQPRVTVLGQQQAGGAWWLVQRSKVFRFPDHISVSFVEAPGGAGVVIYSASVYGRSDLGVNAKRVDAWLAELDRVLG